MSGEQFVYALILTLLGSGGAAFIWTLTRSYLAVNGRIDSREDKVLDRLEKSERNLLAQIDAQRTWGAYWYRRAAMYERELIRNGIPVPINGDAPPEPSTVAG